LHPLQNAANRFVADTMSNAWPIPFIELPVLPGTFRHKTFDNAAFGDLTELRQISETSVSGIS